MPKVTTDSERTLNDEPNELVTDAKDRGKNTRPAPVTSDEDRNRTPGNPKVTSS